jgi:hypothetical protein
MKSSSPEAFSKNVSTEMKSHPKKQALAIAYSIARKEKSKRGHHGKRK